MSENQPPQGYLINSAGDTVESKQLRVYRVLDNTISHRSNDFTILGFKKKSPSYTRGRKIKAEYKCPTADELIVSKVFSDIRDENGTLKGLNVQFTFYCEDGTIGDQYTDEVKEFNIFEAETEERKRRTRQFDYLRASVKGTAYEPYINILISFFHTEITKYKEDGIMTLDSRLLEIANIDLSTVPAEQQNSVGTVKTILNTSIARNDGQGTTTVINSMRYQIGTIEIGDL